MMKSRQALWTSTAHAEELILFFKILNRQPAISSTGSRGAAHFLVPTRCSALAFWLNFAVLLAVTWLWNFGAPSALASRALMRRISFSVSFLVWLSSLG